MMKTKDLELAQNGEPYFSSTALAEAYEAQFIRPLDTVQDPRQRLLIDRSREAWQEEKREAWQQRYGLKPSQARDWPRWRRVLPKDSNRVRGLRLSGARSYSPLLAQTTRLMEEWHLDDHAKLFTRNRQYVYTTQPYGVSLAKWLAFERYWTGLGLFVSLSMEDAWWYPGSTPLIVVSQINLGQDLDEDLTRQLEALLA